MKAWTSTWQGPAKTVTHAVRWRGPLLVLVCDEGFEPPTEGLRAWDGKRAVTCIECLGDARR